MLCTMMVMLAICRDKFVAMPFVQVRTVPLSLGSMLFSEAMDTSSSGVLDKSVKLTSPIFVGAFPPFLEKECTMSFTFHWRYIVFTVHVTLMLVLTQVSKKSVAG